MPIHFACPHCGKQTTVADQYAGQSGPCAQCGKTVNVPFAVGTPNYAGTAAAAGAGFGILGIVVGILIGGVVILVVCGGVLVALLLPAVQQAREAARRMQSQNNMKQILLAMHTYHDVHKCLPPAVVRDASGKPLYSGMVYLLPYMEQQAVYDQFQKDKAWDSPENRALSETNMMIFQDPSNPNMLPGRTDYLLIAGPKSVLEDSPNVQRTFGEVRDGLSNTLILIEVKGDSSWAAPNAWDLNRPLNGNHPGVILVGFADGSVQTIPQSISPEALRLLIEKDDGKVLPPY